MTNALVPCPGCSRHLRRSESTCPFCGAEVEAAMAAAPERAMPTARLSRSALYAFAAVSVGAASCGGDTTTVVSPGPMYGSPPITGGAGGELSVPLYGIAPYTGGVTGAGGEMSAPHYGLPPPTGGAAATQDAGAADASKEDAAPPGAGGGFHALYGGPP